MVNRATFKKIELKGDCFYECGARARGLLTFKDFSEVRSCLACAKSQGRAKIRERRHKAPSQDKQAILSEIYEGNNRQNGFIPNISSLSKALENYEETPPQNQEKVSLPIQGVNHE